MGIAYKLFKYKNGKLYPLYVLANKEFKIGVWIDAEEGPLTENGKVKCKLGELCYRPGLHCATIPLATHIGKKTPDGLVQAKDTVWCEVEYSDKYDYQAEAIQNGVNKNGKLNLKNAYLKHIPVKGYYLYKTNPMMFGEWIICGSIKVNRILTNEEVKEICKSYGYEAQKVEE